MVSSSTVFVLNQAARHQHAFVCLIAHRDRYMWGRERGTSGYRGSKLYTAYLSTVLCGLCQPIQNSCR